MITMTQKKITKRERFTQILNLAEVQSNEELTKFVEHEIELLDRKSASGKGATPMQKKNAEFAKAIIEEMTANPNKIYTITDLIKSVEPLATFKDEEGNPISNQKVSAIVSQLVKNGSVERITEKRRSYFKIVLE